MYDRAMIQRLKHLYDLANNPRSPHRGDDIGRFYTDFREALVEGHLDPQEFPLRVLFEEFVAGSGEFIKAWAIGKFRCLLAVAYDMTVFTNLIGTILYAVAENVTKQFPLSNIVETIPTCFESCRIPGIGGISDEFLCTPQTIKRSVIVSIDACDILGCSEAENGAYIAKINEFREAIVQLCEAKERSVQEQLKATELGQRFAVALPDKLSDQDVNVIKSLVVYLQNWPLSIVPQPSGAEGFNIDSTIAAFKASERGVAISANSGEVQRIKDANAEAERELQMAIEYVRTGRKVS